METIKLIFLIASCGAILHGYFLGKRFVKRVQDIAKLEP
jgi:hypothetical protein